MYSKNNRQFIDIDENIYASDEEMSRIIARLHSAASDPKVLQQMNVEEEYFQAIENRDTAIMLRDQKIKEQDDQIAEQNNQIAEQHEALIKAAKALKSSGITIEQIASMTNLSAEEIRRL